MTETNTIEAPSIRRFDMTAALLALCMLATGASGLVVEYVIATTTTYILGNSIEQFSIIIALMLLMMGIASAVQKLISNKFLLEKFISVEIAMALLGGFAPIGLYAAYGAISDHFKLILYLWTSAIGFLIGLEIPLVMRIVELRNIQLKTNIALIYAADYIGSFIGACVWVSILLKYLPLTEISFVVAGANFIVAMVTVGYFAVKGMLTFKKSVVVGVVITAAILFIGYTNNRGWNVSLEQKLYDDKIIKSLTTKYQHIVITENKNLGDYRLYINGNTQFSSLDEGIYHEHLVHPAMSLVPDHRRVLILGGGDGLALREVLKYKDVDLVTLVDLDPDMIAVAKNDPVLRIINKDAFWDDRVSIKDAKGVSSRGKRPVYQATDKLDSGGKYIVEEVAKIEVINLDADRFISTVQSYYNVIIVDLPDPNSIELTKLYSSEFYKKLRSCLSENGIVAIQSTSPYYAKEAFLCIGRTLNSAGFKTIPYHDNVPSFGDWGWYLAWQSGRAVDSMEKRIQSLEYSVPTVYLTPSITEKSIIFGKNWLNPNKFEVNTLMSPVLLEYYLSDSWIIE